MSDDDALHREITLLRATLKNVLLRLGEESMSRLALEFVLKERGVIDYDELKAVREDMIAEMRDTLAKLGDDLDAMLKATVH